MPSKQVKILKSIEGKFVYLIPRDIHYYNELIYIKKYISHTNIEVLYDSYNITYNKNNDKLGMGTKEAIQMIKNGKVCFSENDDAISLEIME